METILSKCSLSTLYALFCPDDAVHYILLTRMLYLITCVILSCLRCYCCSLLNNSISAVGDCFLTQWLSEWTSYVLLVDRLMLNNKDELCMIMPKVTTIQFTYDSWTGITLHWVIADVAAAGICSSGGRNEYTESHMHSVYGIKLRLVRNFIQMVKILSAITC